MRIRRRSFRFNLVVTIMVLLSGSYLTKWIVNTILESIVTTPRLTQMQFGPNEHGQRMRDLLLSKFNDKLTVQNLRLRSGNTARRAHSRRQGGVPWANR